LSSPQKLSISEQIAFGLKAIHHLLVVHKSLHPNNILIMNKSRFPQVKIADVAMTCDEKFKFYCAPDVLFESTGVIKNSADIFSYGSLLYFIVHEKDPFESVNDAFKKIYHNNDFPFNLFLPNLNHDWKVLISQCWNINEAKRPSSDFLCNVLTKLSIKKTILEKK